MRAKWYIKTRRAGDVLDANSRVNALGRPLAIPDAQYIDDVQVGNIGNQITASIAKTWTLVSYN